MTKSALEVAKYTLFDRGALGASDFKMFPGTSRDTTPEQVAEEITKAIAQIEAGDYEEILGDPEA